MSASPREKLLDEAKGIVLRDRNSVYGNPEDNFLDIAHLWEAYKGVKFTSMDVAIMNMLIKVARLKRTPSYRDGLVDIAGYAACGADIQATMPVDDKCQPTAQMSYVATPGDYKMVDMANGTAKCTLHGVEFSIVFNKCPQCEAIFNEGRRG